MGGYSSIVTKWLSVKKHGGREALRRGVTDGYSDGWVRKEHRQLLESTDRRTDSQVVLAPVCAVAQIPIHMGNKKRGSEMAR